MAEHPTLDSSFSPVRREDYVAVAAFRRALRKFLILAEAGIKEAGVTPQQHQALLAVYANPDRDWISVGELAESLHLKHHAAVELVDRCQLAGLIARSHDAEDRRVVRINLTQKGADALAAITARNLVHLKTFAQLTKELNELT